MAPELFSSGVEDCGGGALDEGRKMLRSFTGAAGKKGVQGVFW